MRRNAVLLTILFAFAITLVSVTFTFWEFYKNNRQQYFDNIFNKYTVIAQIYREHMIKHTSDAILDANLAVYGLTRIDDVIALNEVFEKAEILKRAGVQEIVRTMLFSPQAMIARNRVSDLRATMLASHGRIYFFIEAPGEKFLLMDDSLRPYFPTHLLSAYLTIVLIIAVSIIMILYRIRPLRILTKRAMQYASGNRNVSFRMKGENEIAILANQMEKARENINMLIESRDLFLRNVMHELKTPIAKGRISAEMVKDVKQKERFKSIFIRLEKLINEFALIEELSSGLGRTEKGDYRLIDLLDEAIDQAMVNREVVHVKVGNGIRIRCDFSKMATAIKNMIDNGIKYSPDKRVNIYVEGDAIVFENSGKPLNHPLNYYTEPFVKEHSAKDSFGLGLYLVDAILKLHGMQLGYAFENGKNRFVFNHILQHK